MHINKQTKKGKKKKLTVDENCQLRKTQTPKRGEESKQQRPRKKSPLLAKIAYFANADIGNSGNKANMKEVEI